ncbi:hypothetical protein LVD15_22370 [Fulvivirga maritima]|uniref:hypothetical protein n=1 Tax=Fulvivirga maritima TaxID=2904247 RepID=UPI001F360707|nr:hypothetical protein [Fulvivirga maritima]UII26020.1 hypothetical protein LVD15_22370 [Fulvivirga maritima]
MIRKTLFRTLLISALFTSLACSEDENNDVDPENKMVKEEVGNTVAVESNNVVAIPDPILSAAIKEELSLDSASKITEDAMLSLTALHLDGATDLKDLTGLEYATNLTYLSFGESSVTDLSPIAELTQIQYLKFNDTYISDLSPLASYKSLTYLNANTVPYITDISPIANNTGLRELIIREVPIGNKGMNTIAQFTSLYRVNLRNTGVTDLKVLANLMQQGALLDSTPGAWKNGGADLDLRGLDIDDWSPIAPYLSEISKVDGYN